MNDELMKANGFYKKSQEPTGMSRTLKRSYLEQAIRIYNQEFKNTRSNVNGSSLLKNIGMANLRLADVLDAVDELSEMRLGVFYLKSAIFAFQEALRLKQDSEGSDWSCTVLERIKECYEVGLRKIECSVKDVDKTRMKLNLLDELFQVFPGDEKFKSCLVHWYLSKSHHSYNCSVNCLERNDFRAAKQFLEYAREAVELGKMYCGSDSVEDTALQRELMILEEDIGIYLCCCESVRVRFQADLLFTEYVHEAEELNMEMMWTITDMYRDAAMQTQERDVENEALALSRVGRMFEKILKLTSKGHKYYRAAFALAQTLLPRDLNKFPWYVECLKGIERHQLGILSEEARREWEAKKPVLLKLEKELEELKSKSKDSYELLKHVYSKYPPKVKYTFKENDLDSSTLRTFLKSALTHYHPDRQTRFGLEWKVLCLEITKYLSDKYTCMKGCIDDQWRF